LRKYTNQDKNQSVSMIYFKINSIGSEKNMCLL